MTKTRRVLSDAVMKMLK
ncbi:hypothetical protein HU200_066415 [Digitaria exilis]|uniref:Uncharacterized protein n=1 Tax=Digitaria exilis TaxID=1010633 RepID=A0A835DTZ3_9POAL|nr:hypothetical protein HU200_066413 [Digitaria exilis]KAF8644559.1 hypothetical protein HU200_066415 [Digitaria exilis]